jgi:hypothetical protein
MFFFGGASIGLLSIGLDLSMDVIQDKLTNYYVRPKLENRLSDVISMLGVLKPRPSIGMEQRNDLNSKTQIDTENLISTQDVPSLMPASDFMSGPALPMSTQGIYYSHDPDYQPRNFQENVDNQENLDDLRGRVPEELNDIEEKFDSLELQKLKQALEDYEEVFEKPDGVEILVDYSPFKGGTYITIEKEILAKVIEDETLTTLEEQIMSLGWISKIKSGAQKFASNFRYKIPPKYFKGTWDGSTTSPYFGEFKLFLKQLEDALVFYHVIEERSQAKFTVGNDLNKVLKIGRYGTGSGIDRHLYWLSEYNIDGELSESTVVWDKDEDTLNTWLVRILNEIENNPRVTDKLSAELAVESIFENIYAISGYKYYHPLYRSAKLTLFKVGEVLEEANVMDTNTFSVDSLSQLLQSYDKPQVKYLFNNFQRNPTASQQPSTAINLRDNIIYVANNVPGSTFSNEHEARINEIFNEYLEELAEYRAYDKILKGYEKSYGNSYRLTLLRDLLDKNRPLRQLLGRDMQEFNKLLFGRDQGSLSDAFDLEGDSRADYLTVFNLIYKSYEWTRQTFGDLGITISYGELSQMRKNIQESVYDWIRLAPYTPPLVHQSLIRNRNPYIPELELIFTLLFSARLKTNNPNLDFTALYTQGIYSGPAHKSPLTGNLKDGHPFNTNSLKQFRDILNKWIIEEGNKPDTDYTRQNLYFEAKEKIGLVARLRGRNIRGLVALRERGKFNTPEARVYNVILGLGRHLGFDPGFFRPIQDESFDMTKETKQELMELGLKIYYYARHHFEDNPDRSSLELMIQVLVDGRTHLYWDSMISEAAALVSTQVLENLIKYNRDITKVDIKNEFAKFPDEYTVIMENWFRQNDFTENLRVFNLRKNDVKSMPLDKFIKEHYLRVYTKFYNTLLKEHHVNVRKIIESLHPGIDVSGLVSLGTNDDHVGPFTQVFSYILRDLGYLVYY